MEGQRQKSGEKGLVREAPCCVKITYRSKRSDVRWTKAFFWVLLLVVIRLQYEVAASWVPYKPRQLCDCGYSEGRALLDVPDDTRRETVASVRREAIPPSSGRRGRTHVMSGDILVEAGTITEPSPPVAEPQNKRPTIIIYPTVSPESVVVPIVSCIFGFPVLALLVICCLRRRAKLARERDRRRAGKLDDHGALNLVRFSPIHRLGRTRAVSLRSERSLGRGFPSLELDTVVEEKSDPDPEGTTSDAVNTPDS